MLNGYSWRFAPGIISYHSAHNVFSSLSGMEQQQAAARQRQLLLAAANGGRRNSCISQDARHPSFLRGA